ncbi:hypothetical protein SAMN04487911_106128 [Arenibacter nanhaiticus]|uniref:Uncharacterized protein n=1 Tax=Arenibacter nanhaiticus TaxID=558155 RepID=A0A1M6EED3_9FLAO|nr:hypothetical protein [Arenibacter nanhaiticus]SHI83835.1 hypothetical protein SAMN04487911_106128 [Arenibacter nanhaiticus]
MELYNIEKLLEKYFEATATVAEEEMLRSFFLQKNIPEHLQQYAPMFQYFAVEKEERFTKDLPLKPKRKFVKWVSVAAVAVLVAAINITVPKSTALESEYTQEEIASAQEAFKLLAYNFNKGTKQLGYLEEFQKTTDKFLIKE